MRSDMIPDSAISLPSTLYQLPTIRPISAAEIRGVVFWHDRLLALDPIQGYLLQIDPKTDNTTILNCHTSADWLKGTGLAIQDDRIWFCREDCVYFCLGNLEQGWHAPPEVFITLPYEVEGIAVAGTTLYISSQRGGYIYVYSQETAREITRFPAPGVGVENLTVQGEQLWVSDTTEQTIYCMDRATGDIQFSILTPYEDPTALAFMPGETEPEAVLYVAYSGEEPYVRDNPNADPNYELQFRDRTFIQALYFRYYPQERYALSSGYLMELSYVEELSPLDDVELPEVEWRIALPSTTHRQKVLQVDWVGVPFTQIEEEGQPVAVFKFDRLTGRDRFIFGWKALIQVWSIKYRIKPREVEKIPALSPQMESQYLVDDDDLSMHTPIIRRAASDAIGSETNLLRQIYKIRNYVYDQLSYGIKPHIDPPDVALERGVGSCGEYLGVLLALSRLNGIASRTVGRYKCPKHPDLIGIPQEPDYNHVWMEFYIPGFGWLPMESNPDDVVERGPYPARFFMGLAWYHAEMGKGITFESLLSQGERVNKLEVSIGDLSLNHVRFKVLGALPLSAFPNP